MKKPQIKQRELTETQQKKVAIISLVVAVVFMALVIIFVGIPLVRFISEPERFRQWVAKYGFWGKAAFVGMEVIKVVIAVIPGEPFELAAGYAFGTWMGLLLCTIGITIGSIIVFYLVRKFGMSIVRIFFKQEKIDKMRFLRESKRRDVSLAIIYMIPGTPKDAINYYAGLTGIKLRVWVFICSIGRIPAVVTSTISGDAIGQKKYFLGIAVTVATLVVGLAGLVIYNVTASRHEKQQAAEKAAQQATQQAAEPVAQPSGEQASTTTQN